jgi:hypothetical protein
LKALEIERTTQRRQEEKTKVEDERNLERNKNCNTSKMSSHKKYVENIGFEKWFWE